MSRTRTTYLLSLAASVTAAGLAIGCSSAPTAFPYEVTSDDGGGAADGSSSSGASSSGASSSGASSSGASSSGASSSGGSTTSSSSSGGVTSSSSSGSGSSGSGGGHASSSGGGSDSGATSSSSGSGGADAGSDSGTAAQSEWLDPQNAARATVGEMPLRWDPIAAQVALGWASMCMWGHNPQASAMAEYDQLGGTGGLGENIASGAPTQTVAAAVASWVAEKAFYDHATNTCATGKECGHYTQIVWSTTTGVGCAKVHCTTNSPFGAMYPNWDYSVCDYSPPGNYVGMSPY